MTSQEFVLESGFGFYQYDWMDLYILKKYNGDGSDITIPDYVVSVEKMPLRKRIFHLSLCLLRWNWMNFVRHNI